MTQPCACKRFEFWYHHELFDVDVCRCGHRQNDHLDQRLSCLDDVAISPAMIVGGRGVVEDGV